MAQKTKEEEVLTKQQERGGEQVPYMDFGGLDAALAEQGRIARRRRDEAAKEWQAALEEKRSAREALVAAAKPEDTSRRERSLRRLAIGQSMGELLGSLFGGAVGLGPSGKGYVPRMPGAYRGTLAQLERLRDNGISAREQFGRFASSIRAKDAEDAAGAARVRYGHAVKAEEAADKLRGDLMKERVRAEARRGQAAEAAEARRRLAEQADRNRAERERTRHGYRISEKREAASLRDGGTADGGMDYLAKLLLPKEAVTRTSGGRYDTVTSRERTSYSKAEVAAARDLARRVAPIVQRHGLPDSEVVFLNNLTARYPITWETIGVLLDDGVTINDISAWIADQTNE